MSAASEYTLAPERNFFVAYPGYDQFNEWFSYTRAGPVANLRSIRQHGYRPLKTQTSLLLNDQIAEATLSEFHEELSWRLAGQWNNASQWENGTAALPLSPWIKSGDRVETLSPWQSDRMYQYHVAARQMTWDAATGGRMVLNLERGFDPKLNPNFFADGLQNLPIEPEEVTGSWRDHDQPGHTG